METRSSESKLEVVTSIPFERMEMEDRETPTKPQKKAYSIPKETLKFLKKVKKKEKIRHEANVNRSAIEKATPAVIVKTAQEIRESLKSVDTTEGSSQNSEKDAKKAIKVEKLDDFPAHMVQDQSRLKGEPSVRSVLYKYSQHSQKPWYICPRENCRFKSRHSKNVYTHEKTHNGDRKYCCPICGKTFVLMKNFRLHQAVHQDERNYPCSQCSKRFRSKNNLERHQLTHSGIKPFSCEEEGCTMAFRDKVNLKKHIALKHRGERPFECEVAGCEYVAYDQHAMNRHLVKHKDLQDRPSSVCTICGKTLYGSRSMQSHMLIHEGDSYQCPHCVYTTVFKQALVAHSMRKHGADLQGNKVERNFRCEKCDFSTFWEHDLKFHMAKHGKHRPFKCPICDYSTVLKGSLQKHMRLHTGEQPFVCLLCGKSYTNQSGLARHKRAHTGEKPHSCDICGKRYADLKTLRVHRYSHMNIKPFMCHLCTYTCTKKEVLITHFQRVHGEGNIPPTYRTRPSQRVIMRVTSGQTADEIVHNIAPPGFGERQFVVIKNENMNDEKFMVIQEEDPPEFSVGEENSAEFIPGESVFRIVQTEDGQTTVDTMNKIELPKKMPQLGSITEQQQLESDQEKQQLKVMKIATALKSPTKSGKCQLTLDQLKQTAEEQSVALLQSNSPNSSVPGKYKMSGISGVQPLPAMTVTGQMTTVGALGQNFVIVSGEDANLLKTLELQGQPHLVAIPVNSDNQAGGQLSLQTLIDDDTDLSNVLAEVKSGSSVDQQVDSVMHVTHPILQSQLTKQHDSPIQPTTSSAARFQGAPEYYIQQVPLGEEENKADISQDLTGRVIKTEIDQGKNSQ